MLIVATAGHIDHGKTSLVRALTGVDTDKLPEERARGISIDLGFAYWDAEPDLLVAFVDVPGHHRFIRNMLAGVAAIDFAMLVVAVDDGPMPQTIEHIQILNYLGVRHGVIILSKADTASAQRIAEVNASTRALLAGTTLADIPAVAVSARSGDGLPELKALLVDQARAHEAMKNAAAGLQRRARFAIDRIFTVRGAGTVVTGTVYDGQIACEDRLTLSSAADATLRVRGIQVHGRDVRRAASGERAAINIAGAQLPELSRGDWLIDPSIPQAAMLMDVSLSLLPGGAALRHSSRARLYLGASEIVCRVLLRGRGELQAGHSIAARLQLDGAVVAVNGDRFVLRDGTGTHTLGGGLIVDPCANSRRKYLTESEFDALASGAPDVALDAMLRERGRAGIELARFERIFNLAEASRDAAVKACDAVVLGKLRPVVVTKSYFEEVTASTATSLQQDERTAIHITELRGLVAPDMPAEAFEFLLRAQAERLDISLAGGAVSLRNRRDSARNSDLAAWERIRPTLVRAGLHPLNLDELSRTVDVSAGRLKAILHAQSMAGDVFALQPGKYIVRELVAQLAAAAATTAAQRADGRFTAAQYRDQIGAGRTLAIHALELLDTAGVTRRLENHRSIARDPHQIFGPATPFSAAGDALPAASKSSPAAAARPAQTVSRGKQSTH